MMLDLRGSDGRGGAAAGPGAVDEGGAIPYGEEIGREPGGASGGDCVGRGSLSRLRGG